MSAKVGAMVGPVGPAVGAKVGPVGMKVTPAGNLSFGIAHHLIGEEERRGEETVSEIDIAL